MAASIADGSRSGFTLVELLIVLVILAILVGAVAPTAFHSVDKAREVVLKENLHVLRKAIDDYYADQGRYPAELSALVAGRYLRGIPVDPLTEADAWLLVRNEDGKEAGVRDVRSLATGVATDGSQYASW